MKRILLLCTFYSVLTYGQQQSPGKTEFPSSPDYWKSEIPGRNFHQDRGTPNALGVLGNKAFVGKFVGRTEAGDFLYSFAPDGMICRFPRRNMTDLIPTKWIPGSGYVEPMPNASPKIKLQPPPYTK